MPHGANTEPVVAAADLTPAGVPASVPGAPWMVIRSDDKKCARSNGMRQFLSCLEDPDKNPEAAVPPDPDIVHHAGLAVDAADAILASSLHPRSRRI